MESATVVRRNKPSGIMPMPLVTIETTTSRSGESVVKCSLKNSPKTSGMMTNETIFRIMFRESRSLEGAFLNFRTSPEMLST